MTKPVEQKRYPDDVAVEVIEWLRRIKANRHANQTPEFRQWAIGFGNQYAGTEYDAHLAELKAQIKKEQSS